MATVKHKLQKLIFKQSGEIRANIPIEWFKTIVQKTTKHEH